MNWYLKAFQKYLDFDGRARRSEYWMFSLYNLNFAVIAMILDVVFGISTTILPFGVFYIIYSIVVFIPSLTVTVRRLHDLGKSGWMILISLIPIVGGIWLFVLLAMDGDSGDNDYGEDPKIFSDIDVDSNCDSLILFALIWIFINKIIFAIVPRFIESIDIIWWYKSLGIFMGIIWLVVPISLAAVVKDKTKRIVLFVLGGLYFIYGIYEVLMPFIEQFYNYSRLAY